jgi:hypothetical protein
MQNSGIPTKFPIPFANGAGSGQIRVIPEASQIGVQNGAASLTDGFPPNCFIPIAAGGSWPFGQDFNGLLKQATQWLQWTQAGGPIAYDATFQAAIGGYPQGSIIASATTANLWWLSTTDNNTTNPDSGGAGWANYATALGVTITNIPYDVSGGAGGFLSASQIVLQFMAVRTTTFPSGLTGSVGYLGTVATSSVTLTIQQNTTYVGTIVFNTGVHTGAFAASSAIVLAPGDRLTVTAPSTADATAANLSFTLAGTVV